MGNATRCASVTETAYAHAPAHANLPTSPTTISPSLDFETFAATLRRELAPESRLEAVLANRAALAAWRLLVASHTEFDAAIDGNDLPPISRDTRRAERSLETALSLLETARELHEPRRGRGVTIEADDPGLVIPDDDDDDNELNALSNEWPVLPDERPIARDPFPTGEPTDETANEFQDASDPNPPARWQDRLVFDFNVSDTSPVVKGTWITASHVVTLIVDGWSWSDILRTHPELTEEDIRTCLAYAIDQDHRGDY